MWRRAILIACAAVLLLGGAAALVVRHLLGSDLVRSEIEQQLAARLGETVHIGSASASIFPRIAIDLHDLTVGTPASARLGRVQIVTGIRGLFAHVISDAELIVDDGRIAWPLPFSVGASASVGAPATPSVRIESVRRITLHDIELVTALPPIVLDIDASLAGDRLAIGNLVARSGETRLEAAGAVESLSRVEGRLTVKGRVNVDGYTAQDVGATLAFTPQRFALAPLRFAMFGGTFDGRLDADIHGAEPQLQLKGSVSKVDVADLLAKSGSSGGITGRLSGDAALAAAGADGAALLRSAHGTIHATVVNGALPHLDLVRTVVLAFGKPSGVPPQGSGSSFIRLGGTCALANGTATTSGLSLESRDFDMNGRGALRLESGLVDAHVNAVLSREFTSQAGSDLRRYAQEDGRVIVPVTVSGTLTQPSVFVDVAAAARRAVGNELRRRASSLLNRLFKKKKRG
jgi:hypothetical protein